MFDRPAQHHRRRSMVVVIFTGLLLCMPARIWPAGLAAQQASEYQVKAAFLLNFTKFIEWPQSAFPSSDSPFAICIRGDDPFGPAMDQIVAGEKVNDHKLVIERIHDDAVRGCQVLFVSASEKDATSLLAHAGQGTLTVGDGDDFLHQGGIIAFVLEHRRVRFDISLSAANNAGLKLSSKLLSVAKSVENQ